MKSWLEDNDIKKYSTHNETKPVVLETLKKQNLWIYMTSVLKKLYTDSAGNNILNPGGYRDQIIPLYGGHFKLQAVSWCMPINPVGHHGWEKKNIFQYRSSKTAFPAIFHNILVKNIASFFLLNSACWHWKTHLSLNVFLIQVQV